MIPLPVAGDRASDVPIICKDMGGPDSTGFAASRSITSEALRTASMIV